MARAPLLLSAAALAASLSACPLSAGDPCDVERDACPGGFVCETDDAGEARCHIVVGGFCDGLADVDPFCAEGTGCSEAPDGGPGDAVCGGIASPCPAGRCATGLTCVDAICLQP